jgi:hypothetical protein
LRTAGGVCAMCRRAGDHVDHNHSTGTIRGVLCKKCNTGLGMLGESPAQLRAAASYLEARDPQFLVRVV